MLQYLYHGSEDISISDNRIQYNYHAGIASYATKNLNTAQNKFEGNGKDLQSNERITSKKILINLTND
jgi:parallel beta-helix repeat protein